MGLKIELVGLCGAGKSTFISALSNRLPVKDCIELAHPIVPNTIMTRIYILRILVLGLLTDPVTFLRFLSNSSNWWLIKKIAYRQAGISLREKKNSILVDSGILQPFISFEIEEKITFSVIPLKSLLRGLALPDLVLFFSIPPSIAKTRYELRGMNGEGRIVRKNGEKYFERAEQVRQKLLAYCKEMKIQTVEVDSTREFTDQYLNSKLIEIRNILNNREDEI